VSFIAVIRGNSQAACVCVCVWSQVDVDDESVETTPRRVHSSAAAGTGQPSSHLTPARSRIINAELTRCSGYRVDETPSSRSSLSRWRRRLITVTAGTDNRCDRKPGEFSIQHILVRQFTPCIAVLSHAMCAAIKLQPVFEELHNCQIRMRYRQWSVTKSQL